MHELEQLTDENLALRARQGDEIAFRVLFDRHAASLRRQIQRRLPPLVRRKIAESDVVQMAYLGVHRGLDGFESRGDGSFRAWLEQIVANKVLQVVRGYVETGKRSVGREESGSFHQRSPHAHGEDPSPSAIAVGEELRVRIEHGIAALPPDYREVFDLVQTDGLTLAEVGARMGRTPAAAEKLYGRALARLSALVNARKATRDA
jgi:RNA polymerase sigma-70 factor (ECF subfamily)